MVKRNYVLPALGTFVETGLTVSYRASPEPQYLEIQAHSARVATTAIAPASVRFAAEFISQGFAAGAEFAPWTCSAKVLSGPQFTTDPGARGPDYSWRLEVAGMCPMFVRYFVEKLSSLGTNVRPETLSIVGSLPVDGSPASVTEAIVLRWFDQPAARPGAWPDPGFLVSEKQIPRGASLRLVMEKKISTTLQEKLADLLAGWSSVILHYHDSDGEEHGSAEFFPRIASSKNEITARYEKFDYLYEASRDALINGLSWFHHTVAPIREAHIAL